MGKRSKQRRAHLKRYASDFINVLKGVNKDAMRAYHDRVATVSGPKNNVNPIKNNTWTKPLNPGKVPEKETVIRYDVDKIYIPWQNDRAQGIDTYYRAVRLLEHGDWIYDLFCCGDKYIISEKKKGITKLSIIYVGRKRAESAFNSQRIHWSNYTTYHQS